MLFLINEANAELYADELDSIYRLRCKVLAREFGWGGLSIEGDLERDSYDNSPAIYLGARQHDGALVGCLRLNPCSRPTLTSEVFAPLVEFADIPTGEDYYDVSRFVLAPEVRGNQIGHGLDLMCGMYEWGIAKNIRGYTAVVNTRVLSWLLQIGMRVDPLGLPRKMEREMTLAIYIPVIQQSLSNLYEKSGLSEPRLLAKRQSQGNVAAGRHLFAH